MTKPKSAAKPIAVEAERDETQSQTMARILTGPYWRHGFVLKALSDKSVGKIEGEPQFDDFGWAIKRKAEQASTGDLLLANQILAAQAHSLDALFTEMARRATTNMGEYMGAMETYARLALKAQANCRATLEALIRLHQPREQIVKHVHVNEGGQAVVADNFHQHAGGSEKNEKSIKRSHAAAAAGPGRALLGQDPQGNGVPIPRRQREAAMQDARRDESGTAEGQP